MIIAKISRISKTNNTIKRPKQFVKAKKKSSNKARPIH